MRFLKHADGGLGGNLSAFEVMWNNYYQLVTTPPAQNSAPMAADYPYYVLVEGMGATDEAMAAMLNDALEAQYVADAVIAQSQAQVQGLWALRDDVEQAFRVGPVFLFDVSLRLPHMEAYVEEVDRALHARFANVHNFVLGHVGDGNIHFAISVGDESLTARRGVEACVYTPLESLGGSVSAEHGIGLEKKPYLSLSRSATELALMRTVKQALDPKHLLNPGKIFDVE